jgi:hypothetical protein
MKNSEFLRRVAEKISFRRKKYDDENVPTDLDDIVVIPFFGDIKHTQFLASFLLNNFKKLKKSKYLILISYPGFEHLFPYVDEYWHASDYSDLNQIFLKSDYFQNKSKFYLNLLRTLNENFRNVVADSFFKDLYLNKFTNQFWELFDFETNIFLPMIPSSSVLNKEDLKILNLNNLKIFIYPSQTVNVWSNGKYNKVFIPINFYVQLINHLKRYNIFSVVWSGSFSYDLSNEFKSHNDCLMINSNALFEVLPAIRATGLAVDVFNGFSKLAMIARTPSIIFDERNKYFLTKEYEIDDLLNLNLPNKRIYNFTNSIIKGNESYWTKEIFEPIASYCLNYFSYFDKESLPNTAEIDKKMEISLIRKIQNKKLGTKFIKVDRLI